MRYQTNKKGFTLIELLIVIAIIAILASIVFVALDPLTRFRDARDANRYTDVEAIANAIKLDEIDNGGVLHSVIDNMAEDYVYMIVGGGMASGCSDNNAACDTDVTGSIYCADLSYLVDEGYLPRIPVSPRGEITWDTGEDDGGEGTGYTIEKVGTSTVAVRACESENSDEIEVVR